MAETNTLNGPQKQHLLSSCQYADKLLSDIEAILRSSDFKPAFPKYNGPLAPARSRIVEDYISRIRSQMVRSLESQGIKIPEPRFGTLHSLRVTLVFVAIALEECTADKMVGYGPLSPQAAWGINGVVEEIKSVLDQLSAFLAQDLDRDPNERLLRLERAGNDVLLLKKLEAAISEHGLVDFRSRLAAILDRLESKTFEIAIFGRVSSGKSSLLNRIVGAPLLPVGTNPITSVPTFLRHGDAAQLTVQIAGQKPQIVELARIAEFVTEEQNPANRRAVENVVIEYPSIRLAEGMVFVDTPGLGSLATAGAKETLAYLPRCDLGVLLVDAASTLTKEDLATIELLNRAGIRTAVLLSKVDLLDPSDRERALAYLKEQIRENLRLDPPVYAVSVREDAAALIDHWFDEFLLPLSSRHSEALQQSLQRKIGALREAVAGSLQTRMDRTSHSDQRDKRKVGRIEEDLRRAAGKFEEIRTQRYEEAEAVRDYGPDFILYAARQIADGWNSGAAKDIVTWEILSNLALHAAAEKSGKLRKSLEDLDRDLAAAIKNAAAAMSDRGQQSEDLSSMGVSQMPIFNLGSGEIRLSKPWFALLSLSLTRWYVEHKLRSEALGRISDAFRTYGGMLESWSGRVVDELRRNFDTWVHAYQSQIGGAESSGESLTSIQRTLESLNAEMENPVM